MPQSYAEPLAAADQIFIGRAVRVSADHSRSLFEITQKFKGNLADTLTVRSKLTSCGISFQTSLTYVVYAKQKQVSRCGGSAVPITVSQDLGKLYYSFHSSFADGLGRDSSSLLNLREATYFNSELQGQRGSFDIQGRRVAFFDNTLRIDKQQYVRRWHNQRVVSNLLMPTPAEKPKAGGIDAIVVSCRKQGVVHRLRRRLINRLSRRS